MRRLVDGELLIEGVLPSAGVIRLDWKGRSDNRQPGDMLNPFLTRVLDEAVSSATPIEMHFEALEYLNSSSIGVLMHFLNGARAAKVPLSFVYQPKVRWQKLSFEALRVFEQLDNLVRVVALAQ